MLEELLPPPVLAIGLTGHRSLAEEAVASAAIAHGLGAVLDALKSAAASAFTMEATFFSAAAPLVRLVTMGAEGADLLGVAAAEKCGIGVSCVIPFSREEFCRDFSPATAAAAAEVLGRAEPLLELPGRREEGARAYERANDVILANVDLLLAVWDGERARGRAGTGDAVQAAVVKGIPVIVIDPQSPDAPALLLAPPPDEFELPNAGDLARRPLPADLTDLVHALVGPPSRRVTRQGLVDLLDEKPGAPVWRFEYPVLLKALARRPTIRPTPAVSGAAPAGARARAASAFAGPPQSLDRARKVIDAIAVQYGRRFRSSSVSQYLVVIFGVWISGVVGLLIPALSAASIAVQLLANALVLADSAFRTRQRWQQRWLDYRVVAERLRWLGFRYPFGLGAGQHVHPGARRGISWIDWYVRRTAYAVGLPSGKIDAAMIATAADYLTEVEIPGQIDYHRATFRQLGLLERRLSFAAHAALVAALGVAVLLAIAAIRAGSLNAVGWRPLAIVLLAVLPATMTGLNGLRVDADLVRLVERSAQTIALLFRVRRAILATVRDYDHVAANMQRLASIMGNELEEWRFVIESRRSRASRRRIRKKGGLLRRLRGNRRDG